MSLITRNKISSEFSMSSMSDLVFLLLIFFMITSTMIAPNALKLLLPSSNSQTQAKPIANVFIKDLNNGIYEYGVGTTKLFDYKPAESEFDKGKIELAIKKEIAGQEEPCIALHVDKSVPMEEVVRVMNIAKDNNWKLILATKPIKN